MTTLEEMIRAIKGSEAPPSSTSWADRALPMEGRSTFLPFQDTMPGSVMNKRSVALPGILAGAVNAITAPGRAYRGSDPTFNPEEEALNFGLNTMGGGLVGSKVTPPPIGSLGMSAGSRAKPDPRTSVRSSKEQNIAEGLYHPIGGGIKLVRPLSEMTSTRVPNIPMVARREISPEDLYGGYIVPALGDRTAAGSLLTHIGDTKLANPVQLEGGADFMRTHAPYGAAWAADKGAASSISKQIRGAAESGRDVYMPYVAMAHTPSGDFSTMMANSLLGQIGNSKITKKAVNEFDRNIKAVRPEFKGLLHPETRDMLNDNGALRHAFVSEMGLKPHSNAGFPDLATTRAAIFEPGLLDSPLHSSGFTIAKMNPAGSIITDPASPAHTTYNTQLAGNYVGGFAAQPPRSVMFPSFYNERRAAGKPESSDFRSFQLNHPGQVANQEWLDSVMGWMEKNPKSK